MKYPDWYRDWLDNVREDAREFGVWRAEELETIADLDYHYNQFLTDLAARIDENKPPDDYKWLARGEKEIAKLKNRLTDKYDIPVGDEGKAPNAIAQSGSLFGFPIIDPDNPPSEAKRRNTLFPDLASIVDYTQDVPYPAGFEPIYANGVVIGYYLWVSK